MHLARLILRTVAASALLAVAATTALAAPLTLRFPDGTDRVIDDHHVSPFLAAWKAEGLARQRAAATATTPNQAQYDVRWYDLDLAFTPATSMVSGTVRMKATVVSGPITTVDLDFDANLVMDGATCAGAATTWTRAGDVLTLALDRAYADGEMVDVRVTYHGVPTAGGYFGFQTVNSRQLIWSLSEAYGSRTWWPCKDAPEDKPDSVDVHFTCPTGLTTVSNGTLVSTVVNGATTTTSWHERYPVATYLVFIASYPYTLVQDWYVSATGDSLPLRFNIVPESVAGAAASDALVKSMIAAYASRMGEYPFMGEKYGHAQFTFSGGMEHQTNTCLGVYVEYITAHELMHQWWGDLVTCRDFHHIWLNEGFATYGEALWAEATGGTGAYHAYVNTSRYLGAGTVWVPDATDETRVFDSNLSYDKGGWVLHMLRHVLGDDTFFAALRAYRAQWGYASATTEDFRDVCEAVSGRDLHAFFQQWIYGEYYPVYRADWTSAPAAGGGWDVALTLKQTQSWQLFTMPVDVTIATAGGETTFVVPDSLATQDVVLHVDAPPQSVTIDKDGWILHRLESVVTAPQFDRAVLLVNGVDWATYGTEITSAYTDKAFSGAYNIDFWDAFAAPAGGYPAALPAPLGHGAVPAEVMGHYRNVVWVGNNYNGDLASWQDTPVLSYLRVGGNLLLMSRMGDSFLGDSLRPYLGINWANTGATLNDCLATRPGFVNVSRIGTQSSCAVFDTVRTTAESQLLFRVSSGFNPSRGIGAIRVPAAGAGFRPRGGRFAFLSGRPYRWNHTQLSSNATTVLKSWFLEPIDAADVAAAPPAATLALAPPSPNPARGPTRLAFSLPRTGPARLALLDVAGRRVRTLVDGPLEAGAHDVTWDGRDERGVAAPAGLYWARLECGGESAVRRLVRIR
jgi:aminopeptidase N